MDPVFKYSGFYQLQKLSESKCEPNLDILKYGHMSLAEDNVSKSVFSLLRSCVQRKGLEMLIQMSSGHSVLPSPLSRWEGPANLASLWMAPISKRLTSTRMSNWSNLGESHCLPQEGLAQEQCKEANGHWTRTHNVWSRISCPTSQMRYLKLNSMGLSSYHAMWGLCSNPDIPLYSQT